MATPGTDEDHEMEDQSDIEDESRLETHDESQLNGQNDIVHESSTPTDYSLFEVHHQLGKLRQQLHDLDTPIELPKVDFEAIIPYMDNVWRKLKSSEQPQASENTELYWCKLRKHPGAKPHIPRPTPEGKQARKRKPKEEKACGMAMKVTYSSGLDKVMIMKAVEGEKHTHDLDLMDQQKRNSGVMDTARREAVRGFQPASIWWKMQQEPDKLEAAGGKFMKISDVRNVQYPWRQENPDVPLKAHTGYNSARTGPKLGQQNPRIKTSPSDIPAQPAAGHRPPLPHENHAPPHYHQYPPQQQQQPPQPPQQQQQQQGAPQQDTINFPLEHRAFLGPYLPEQARIAAKNRPHVTLTWAQGLDGRIASSPGYKTSLSGNETKAMTHFLRSTHDAILIGVRTAIADDPGLNCRLAGAGGYGSSGTHWQPRPIIMDPTGRLIIRPEMKILKVAAAGQAKAPWIIVGPNANLHPVAVSTLKSHGGEYLMINDVDQYGRIGWEGLFQVLFRENIRSIMIEGGGLVLSELLSRRYMPAIDSVIMTVVPTFLGKSGVEVSPHTEYDNNRMILQNRLREVRWQAFGGGGEVVMCGKVEQPQAQSNGILQGIVEMASADGTSDQQRPPQQQHAPPHAGPPHQGHWPPPGQHGQPPPSQGLHYPPHPQHGPPPQHNHLHHGPLPPGQPQNGPPPQQGPAQQQGPPPPQGSPPQHRPSQPPPAHQPPPPPPQQQHPYHPPAPPAASPRQGAPPPRR